MKVKRPAEASSVAPGVWWRAPIGLICSVLVLAGCASGSPAPIENRQSPASVGSVASERYSVRLGDTLYAIAFRFGVDYRTLAATNGIAPPYIIYPGQSLIVRPGRGQPVASAPLSEPSPSPPARSAPPAGAATPSPAVAFPAVSPSHSPTVTSPMAAPANVPAPSPRTPAPPLAAASKPAPPLAPVGAWRWPSQGPVTRGYSATVHKGIDIGGRRGEPVVAVAAGDVVYAGTGIVGFGELLIIKHDDVYLSAYGHNDRLLVAEGARVSAGQQIAEKGSTGTDVVKLHFEIRKEGKPIDPIQLLPRR